jgi:hypothetical protein
MLTKPQNKALYPLLQHYIGSEVKSISTNNGSLLFVTLLGQKGEIIENADGDREITIDQEVVYKIEKKVFETLITPDSKNTLEDYLDILKNLAEDKKITYRSKILVNQILKVLESYIINSDFLPQKMIEVRPFFVFSYKGDKFINCLN